MVREKGSPAWKVGLPGWNLSHARLHHDAEDGVLELIVLDAGAVHSLPDRRPTELGRAQGRQRPAEFSEGRPRRPQDHRTFQCDSFVFETNDHSLSPQERRTREPPQRPNPYNHTCYLLGGDRYQQENI